MSSPEDAFIFIVELVEGRGFGTELQALSLIASFGGETKSVRKPLSLIAITLCICHASSSHPCLPFPDTLLCVQGRSHLGSDFTMASHSTAAKEAIGMWSKPLQGEKK